MRAKLSENSFSDISNYFADTHIQGKTIIHFLLEHTRHTPRDFIQLLNSLQATARNKKLTKAEVLNGLRDYSQNYFFPEIKDEMEKEEKNNGSISILPIVLFNLLFTFISTVTIIIVICFVLIKLLPINIDVQLGKDREIIEAQLRARGYFDPIPVQLFNYIKRINVR